MVATPINHHWYFKYPPILISSTTTTAKRLHLSNPQYRSER